MEDYIFICPECNIILNSDELIEEHSACGEINNSCKYWNEDYIRKHLNEFIEYLE